MKSTCIHNINIRNEVQIFVYYCILHPCSPPLLFELPKRPLNKEDSLIPSPSMKPLGAKESIYVKRMVKIIISVKSRGNKRMKEKNHKSKYSNIVVVLLHAQ